MIDEQIERRLAERLGRAQQLDRALRVGDVARVDYDVGIAAAHDHLVAVEPATHDDVDPARESIHRRIRRNGGQRAVLGKTL